MIASPLFVLALAASSLAAAIDQPMVRASRRAANGAQHHLVLRAQQLIGTGEYRPDEACPGALVDEGTQYGAQYHVYYSPEAGGTACMILDNVSGAPLQMLAAVFSADGEDYAADGGMTAPYPVNGYAGSVRITGVGSGCWSWGMIIGNVASQSRAGQHCPGE